MSLFGARLSWKPDLSGGSTSQNPLKPKFAECTFADGGLRPRLAELLFKGLITDATGVLINKQMFII